MKTISLELRGRVQKVGFRFYVYRLASELGVTGFVRNKSDGSVYVEAESDSDKLSVFVAHCKKGPPHSTVEKCVSKEIDSKNFKDFRIC